MILVFDPQALDKTQSDISMFQKRGGSPDHEPYLLMPHYQGNNIIKSRQLRQLLACLVNTDIAKTFREKNHRTVKYYIYRDFVEKVC